jgi:hypothetical protein
MWDLLLKVYAMAGLPFALVPAYRPLPFQENAAF